jgi:NADP-dependent 3-hydroxy acid dehydrogenase YdfG
LHFQIPPRSFRPVLSFSPFSCLMNIPSIRSTNPASPETNQRLPTLQDRVVWITGAGSGIGRAMAVGFATAGAKVAVTGRRIEVLHETASQIGETALVVPADVSKADQVERAYETVSQTWGAVDILVNNAGRNSSQRHLHQLTVAEMSSMLDVNLKTAFLCSMAVLPAMRARKSGTLIHIGSMSATMVFPTAGASYAAAKAGVRQMSAHINAEEGIHGIRSICIHPGEVATEILASRPKPPTPAEQALMLQAEDIATMAVFVAGLPGRVTVSDLTIVPTDNQAWRSYAQAIANG